MKLAIVHDFLNQFGGAERVVLALNKMFPEAPIYTSIYDRERMPAEFKAMDIRVSWAQHIPGIMKNFRNYFWFFPFVFSRINLSGYDVILSSSSMFAKGVRKPKGAVHICYCYNPMRFAWRYNDYVAQEDWRGAWGNFLKGMLLPWMINPIKAWDIKNSKEVDHFVAISKIVANRIKDIYGRESAVIYPPVETDFYVPEDPSVRNTLPYAREPFYLVVSRLNAYKRVDLVVETFNRLGLKLLVVGSGPQSEALKKQAKPNIVFLGKVNDEKLRGYYSCCEGLIFPGEEDFGIVPVEAMACGAPVIAFRAGGAEETVLEGETGMFFNEQTPESLSEALKSMKRPAGGDAAFSRERCRQRALEFSRSRFTAQIKRFIIDKVHV